MRKDIKQLAYNWITADSDNTDVASSCYCQTRDVFQARLEKMNSHKDALNTAFTKVISSRYPERRGNGLKFVKNSVESKKFNLMFKSADPEIKINKVFKIKERDENINGCLVIIKS